MQSISLGIRCGDFFLTWISERPASAVTFVINRSRILSSTTALYVKINSKRPGCQQRISIRSRKSAGQGAPEQDGQLRKRWLREFFLPECWEI